MKAFFQSIQNSIPDGLLRRTNMWFVSMSVAIGCVLGTGITGHLSHVYGQDKFSDQVGVTILPHAVIGVTSGRENGRPLLVLMGNVNSQWSAWEILGVAVWMIGISGEGMADRQLMRFRRDPSNAGKVCRDGLWRYSRHPNYFFEGVLWCGYVLMGVGVPNGWITLVGPVLMIGSLLKVTGIPLAEAQALHSRGDAYREYQRTTSVFIPWFPKQ